MQKRKNCIPSTTTDVICLYIKTGGICFISCLFQFSHHVFSSTNRHILVLVISVTLFYELTMTIAFINLVL